MNQPRDHYIGAGQGGKRIGLFSTQDRSPGSDITQKAADFIKVHHDHAALLRQVCGQKHLALDLDIIDQLSSNDGFHLRGRIV